MLQNLVNDQYFFDVRVIPLRGARWRLLTQKQPTKQMLRVTFTRYTAILKVFSFYKVQNILKKEEIPIQSFIILK